MFSTLPRAGLAASILFATSMSATAHMTLETQEAAPGASYKAVLRVPHGCGDIATTKLSIKVPEGFHSVKPMPHAGWELETVNGAYAHTYLNHGSEVKEGVLEVIWSGGNLPNAFYDEFVMRGTFGADLADGTVMYFPAVQECADGAKNEWIGEIGDSELSPAPKLTLVGAQMDAHAGHDMSAMSSENTLGDLTIDGAFTRAMPPTAKVGGGYLTITNDGADADRLVSASSSAAPVVQLHEMKMEGDVMKMGELPNGVNIPAGESVSLSPGGLHVMFMQVPTPFAEGESVPVTLTFEKAGSIDVMFKVAPLGSTKAPMDHSGH